MYTIYTSPNLLHRIMGLSQINLINLVSYFSPHQIPKSLYFLEIVTLAVALAIVNVPV